MIIPTLIFEQELWKKGFFHVAGVDEVGRGPLAGPVLAGAVVIHSPNQVVKSVRDSKLMTRSQREKAAMLIYKKSSATGMGLVSNEEIDTIGIARAVKKAMTLALLEIEKKLGEKLSFVLVDGSKTQPLSGFTSKRILKGGLYHYSISAASVIAKVTRDEIMKNYASRYPTYGFENHVGYGTREHYKALNEYGPCPIHRNSFL